MKKSPILQKSNNYQRRIVLKSLEQFALIFLLFNIKAVNVPLCRVVFDIFIYLFVIVFVPDNMVVKRALPKPSAIDVR